MERPDLAEELERLATEDLTVRQRLIETGQLFGGYHPEMRAVHRRNGDRLRAILDEFGSWPGFRLVAEDGSEAALLIAQHDVANPSLMRRCLELYTTAAEKADAEPTGVAYLEDRIRAFEGHRQKYGTQVGWNDDGEFGPWPPVEDPGQVDARRAELGLPPLADAIRETGAGRPARRPVDEVLNERQKGEVFARESGWRDGPTQTIEIRRATPDDADAAADYHHRCFMNTYSSQLLAGEFEAPDPEGTRQQLLEWFQPGSEFDTRVAIVGGAPIGHFTVRHHQLVHLFVEPDHQGTGLGRHLLGQGEALIMAAGHTDFELHARVDNVAAIAFYTAAGWTVSDRLIHTVEHGISYDEHVLVKHCR